MPSPMIHLLTARRLELWGDPLFMLGSIAPDYCSERKEKDRIHLRDEKDRPEAIRRLRDASDIGDPFTAGWILHLFTDLCWDETMIPAFRERYGGEGEWFQAYSRELHLAGYALFREKEWARAAFGAILSADLSLAGGPLCPGAEQLDAFRRMIFQKHESSAADSRSEAFPIGIAERFAEETAEKAERLLRNGEISRPG